MTIPIRQTARMGAYVMKQRLRHNDKYPLIVELEPLFQCNLACEGCGKIQHPEHELRRRMPVAQAIAAVEECGAPMVSIAGGEPLIHPEIDEIARQLIARKKFVYLCTNALLLEKKLDLFKPSPYFSWAVHIDGLRERHDQSVAREGVFDKAVAAIKAAKAKGFRVTTNTTFFTQDSPETVRSGAGLPQRRARGRPDDDLARLRVREGARPGALPRCAPDARAVRAAFADGRRKKWRLNHSPLFLDFLEGKADFRCTPWGIPSYSLFGWQRPCYLMADGYTETYKELLETTDWDKYGRGNDPRCENCMAHCGYEPTAVVASTQSLKQSLRALAQS